MNNKLLFDKKLSKARELADSATTIKKLKVNLEKFAEYIRINDGCHCLVDGKELGTSTVFGELDKDNSKIIIIGEAPGKNEDKECKPFCGDSGVLLDKMLKKIGIDRNDLCITNTVFWRPCKDGQNRTPTIREFKICRPFLEKQIALVNPKMIICLGNTSLRDLMNNTKLKITDAVKSKKEYEYKDGNKQIKVIPAFHPSYLMRIGAKDNEEILDKYSSFIKEKIEKL